MSSQMLERFRADVRRYVKAEPRKSWVGVLLTKEGLWAIAEYRFNHWVHYQVKTPGLRQLLKFGGAIAHKFISLLTGIDLPKEMHIGPGLYISHKGSIVLHPFVSIGENCTLSHEVTIGEGGRGEKRGWPKIGDRVYIAPGAKVFGAITIGHDVAIGANAVVNKSFGNMAVVAGIPAKVLSYRGAGDFIELEGAS